VNLRLLPDTDAPLGRGLLLCFAHVGPRRWRAIRVARKLKATEMIDVLPDLFILRGVFAHMQLVTPLKTALSTSARASSFVPARS
jgi:hypothetical protein